VVLPSFLFVFKKVKGLKKEITASNKLLGGKEDEVTKLQTELECETTKYEATQMKMNEYEEEIERLQEDKQTAEKQVSHFI